MKLQKITQWFTIVLFSVALICCCVLGFLVFLRPTVSDSEERELTKFPSFSMKTFLSGEYTSQINLWYSDTFPGRDVLLDMNAELKSLYGIQNQSFGGGHVEKDTINPDESFVWDEDDWDDFPSDEDTENTTATEIENTDDTDSSTTETVSTETAATEQDVESTEPIDEEDEGYGEAHPENSVAGGQKIEGYFIKGDTAYQLYYFKKDWVDRYTRMVTKTAISLNGIATVYDMVIPTPCNYGMTQQQLDKYGASNQSDAIEYMYNALNAYSSQLISSGKLKSPVVPVDIRDTMYKHYDEYIYFRTDHHWTGLGAYYASRCFLDMVSRDYPALEEYNVVTIPDFLGSLYKHTQNTNLKNNPDTVYAYESPTVNDFIYLNKSTGKYVNGLLVKNASQMAKKSNKYLAFTEGDRPYYEIHNPTITDGSAVLVIRESFGNAFLPMLADSYEYVYAVDYRHWTGDLVKLVKEKNIDTVLFLNNIMATADSYTVECMEQMTGTK